MQTMSVCCRTCNEILAQLYSMNLEVRRLHVTVTNQIHSIKKVISEPIIAGGEIFLL